MKKIEILWSCVFIFLTAFSCLKFPQQEEKVKLEFDPPKPRALVMTPETSGVVPKNVLKVDGVDVSFSRSSGTLTAKDADGNTVPVLTEGDVVSSANVPDGSPKGKSSGDFLAVVVKQDGSGYGVGLIKSTRDATHNDSALGSWVDESGASVVAGITLGKAGGGTVDDGKIYLGDANKKVTIAGTNYAIDEKKGQIDTLPFFIGRWFNGVSNIRYLEFDSSGAYRDCYVNGVHQCINTGTWSWNGVDIQFHGKTLISYYRHYYKIGNTLYSSKNPADPVMEGGDFPTNPILKNVSIDPTTHQLKAVFNTGLEGMPNVMLDPVPPAP